MDDGWSLVDFVWLRRDVESALRDTFQMSIDPFDALFSADFRANQPRGPVSSTIGPELRVALQRETIRVVDTAVLGGGIAGLFAALRIAESSTEKHDIVLIEREQRLGGRVYDVDLSDGTGEHVGLGAWRFKDSDVLVAQLMRRFNISFEDWEVDEIFVEVGGEMMKPKDLRTRFPSLPSDPDFNLVRNLVDRVCADPVAVCAKYPTLHSLCTAVYGAEGVDYLSATYGAWTAHMHADLGWLISRWFRHPRGQTKELRPRKGMGELITCLARACEEAGVETRKGEPVLSVEKVDVSDKIPGLEGGGFLIRTTQGLLACRSVISTLTPVQLGKLDSSFLTQHIFSQPIFKALLPARAFKAAMSFATAWWEPELSFPPPPDAPEIESMEPPNGHPTTSSESHAKQRRRYPAMSSKSTPLGLILPYRSSGPPYVLHAAYTDDPGSVAQLAQFISNPIELKGYILSQLSKIFGRTIPEPIAFEYAMWDQGSYHYQTPGSGFPLSSYLEWSAEPVIGERFALAGESYGDKRAWCEGSLESAKRAVDRLFGTMD